MKKMILLSLITFVFSVDYETEIQPIWNANCGGCHTSNSQGGLNLSNYENLMSSGAVIPGDHMNSSLYDRITRPESAQGDMPPAGSLSDSDIALIAEWIDEGALSEESNDIVGCMDPNAITCDDDIDPLYFPECDTCSDNDPCDNYYNSNATVDNGLCMYNDVPSYDEVTIEYVSGDPSVLEIDWSAFSPPVNISQYVLMRCADIDGDTDGDGDFEYELCVLIVAPFPQYTNMYFTDDFSDATEYSIDDIAAIKYTLSVGYPTNPYWGAAFGNYYYEPSTEPEFDTGDLNFDGVVNVIDVVTLVNGILSNSFTDDQTEAADLNGDGLINVIDIVSLVNLILG